jgi:asparagine synthase (glutamine-hydrolysing)
MCGICGIVSNSSINKGVVKAMNNAMVHRGPSGEGYYDVDGLSMGMRRLSIIDLNTGWQPLYNEDKSLVLMVNGEIYNYLELRADLKTKGHTFATESDGETILHLYEEYGVDCLSYLRGMFTFCLWDEKNQKVFIARDRMGEKPLYLYEKKNQLIFSSELRSLLASKQIEIELDPVAIDMFFHYHFVPEPLTPIKHIRKLPAGHYITIDKASMKIEQVEYWNMEDAPILKGDPITLIKEQLNELSKLVVRSDVPVGVALSGGVDSAIVAALAVKYYKGNMHAFTIGYEGRPESDERYAAQKIAQHLGMPFHEIELTNKEFISNFPSMCSHTDDPIADISAFGYYSVSKSARMHGVPVLLQGQGGDELFWGYNWVQNNFKYVELKNNESSFSQYYKNKFSEKFSAPTFKKFTKGILSYRDAKKLYLKHKNEKQEIFPFYDYFTGFNADYKEIYGDLMINNFTDLDSTKPFHVKKPWQNTSVTLTRLISQTYLLENGIAQGDRLSMANSVELRLPLVDYRLVETVIGLRKSIKDNNLPSKYWLKEIGKEMLPHWIFEARKRGFEPPVELWLNGILKEYGNKLIDGHLVQKGVLNRKAAFDFSKGKSNPQVIFPGYFNALVLELWLESIIKN